MLRIVHPVCCGLDVHKSFVFACIATTDENGVTTYQSRKFSTFTCELVKLAEWLAVNNCKDVCMESTGKYWYPVWNILEPTCNLVIAHPKYVKAIRGKKTDKKDAKWIADIFKHDLVSGSFIPPADIRQLRDLTRYYRKLVGFNTGEKNRAQNCLTISNIKLDDVFSDVFGKSATAITDRLLEHPGETFDVAPYVHYKCKTPIPEIQAAVDGSICHEQAEKLKIIRSHMGNLELCKAELESVILGLAQKYQVLHAAAAAGLVGGNPDVNVVTGAAGRFQWLYLQPGAITAAFSDGRREAPYLVHVIAFRGIAVKHT